MKLTPIHVVLTTQILRVRRVHLSCHLCHRDHPFQVDQADLAALLHRHRTHSPFLDRIAKDGCHRMTKSSLIEWKQFPLTPCKWRHHVKVASFNAHQMESASNIPFWFVECLENGYVLRYYHSRQYKLTSARQDSNQFCQWKEMPQQQQNRREPVMVRGMCSHDTACHIREVKNMNLVWRAFFWSLIW